MSCLVDVCTSVKIFASTTSISIKTGLRSVELDKLSSLSLSAILQHVTLGQCSLADVFNTKATPSQFFLIHWIKGYSPGNEVIMDHWKWTKRLKKVFQQNLTPRGYVKTPIKPHPNPPWGKHRFRVKSKKAAIKPVIYVNF